MFPLHESLLSHVVYRAKQRWWTDSPMFGGPLSLCTSCILMGERPFLFIFKNVSNSITDWRAEGFKTEVLRFIQRGPRVLHRGLFLWSTKMCLECQHICIKEDIFITHKEESQKASITAAKTALFLSASVSHAIVKRPGMQKFILCMKWNFKHNLMMHPSLPAIITSSAKSVWWWYLAWMAEQEHMTYEVLGKFQNDSRWYDRIFTDENRVYLNLIEKNISRHETKTYQKNSRWSSQDDLLIFNAWFTHNRFQNVRL